MTIHLNFSNNIERLAEKLAFNFSIEAERAENILKGPSVIVPSANLTKWLQLYLARKDNILMNINFIYLETGLWEMLRKLDSTRQNIQRLDLSRLQIFILHLLLNLDGDEQEFELFNRYLFSFSKQKNDSYTIKLWQLVQKLASLFFEYEYQRSAMIRRWLDPEEKMDGLQKTEKALYLNVKNLKTRLYQKTGNRFLSIMEYADRLFLTKNNPIQLNMPKTAVHLFGLSQVSTFHLELFGHMGRYYEIYIYTLNPSREFWEDTRTPGEKKWIEYRNAKKFEINPKEKKNETFFDENENMLLSLWGKPGRESIRLLCQLAEYNFNSYFTGIQKEKTLLKRIQNDILTLADNSAKNNYLDQDRSLQIIACPGIFREVETVFNSILYHMSGDKHLQLTDIAVLVPDILEYKPVIDSVFNRHPKRIDYNLVETHAEIESIYGQAILSFLEIATGRFSRKEIFDLILNPCFMKKWKIDRDEIRAWSQWTEDLNIFHTFDLHSKYKKGYTDSYHHTWDHGLKRLRLSRIMLDPTDLTDNEIYYSGHFKDLIPFSDINSSDDRMVEKFSTVIEVLHLAVSKMHKPPFTARGWKMKLFSILNEILEIPKDFKGEKNIRSSLIQSFECLTLFDELDKKSSKTMIDINFIKEFIRTSLRSISGGFGDYLTGGVTVSTFAPLRPIPFKIVYTLGMQEGKFPGEAETSSLDLRSIKRKIGDMSLPERNNYLFLEMLISVKKQLYISYISKDLKKDRTQEPCSTVKQLCRYIEKYILKKGNQFKMTHIPLLGRSEIYIDPQSINPFSDVLINYSLRDRIELCRITGLWDQLADSLFDKQMLEHIKPDFSVEAGSNENEGFKKEKIMLSKLRKYLEDPFDCSVKYHLGIFDEEESIEHRVLREDEPFYTEFPNDYHLKMDSVNRWLEYQFSRLKENVATEDKSGSQEFFQKVCHPIYLKLRRESKTPDEPFSVSDQIELRHNLTQTIDILTPFIIQMKEAKNIYRKVFLGESAEEPSLLSKIPSSKTFEPINLCISASNDHQVTIKRNVELQGHLPWVWQDKKNLWHALIITGSKKNSNRPDKYLLEPFLFYLSCLIEDKSMNWIGENPFTFHIIYNETAKEWRYAFKPHVAKKYLKTIVSDYLDPNKIEWLPFEKTVLFLDKIPPGERFRKNKSAKNQYMALVKEALAQESHDWARIVKPKIQNNAFETACDRFLPLLNKVNRG